MSLVGALVATLAVTGVSDVAEGSTPEPAPTLLPEGETYQVTLLTGDVVTVTGAAEGCPRVRVEPGADGGVMTSRCDPDGHVHVVPRPSRRFSTSRSTRRCST